MTDPIKRHAAADTVVESTLAPTPKMAKIQQIIPIKKWLNRDYPDDSNDIARLIVRYAGNTGIITTSSNQKYVTYVFEDKEDQFDVVFEANTDKFKELNVGDLVEFHNFMFIDLTPESPYYKQRAILQNETYIQFEDYKKVKKESLDKDAVQSFDAHDSMDLIHKKDDELSGIRLHLRAITSLQEPINKMSSDGKHAVPYHMTVKDLNGEGRIGYLSIWPGVHTDMNYFNPQVGDEFQVINVTMKLYGTSIQLQSHPASVFTLDVTLDMLAFDQKTIFGVKANLLHYYAHGKCCECSHPVILNSLKKLVCDQHGEMTDEVTLKNVLEINLHCIEKNLKTQVQLTKEQLENWGLPKELRTLKGLEKYFAENSFTVDIKKKQVVKLYVRQHF